MDSRQAWRDKLLLHFREGVSLVTKEGRTHLASASQTLLPLTPQSPAVLETLEGLHAEGATEAELVAKVARKAGALEVATFLLLLRRLQEHGFLSFSLRNGSPFASLHPSSPWFRPGRAELDPERAYVLSRFAYQRRLGQHLVLESPRCHARLRLEAPHAAALCLALARPSTLGALAAGGAEPELVEPFLGLLLATGLALPADDEGQTEEEQSPRLAPWAFHDLLFHARSRLGRHEGPFGKTFPFRDRFPPPPALPPLPEDVEDALPLHRPELAPLLASDVPFTAVLESRRSERTQGADPLSLETLGDFLYRAARVREHLPTTPGPGYEQTRRPYPSGGACYDLELYLAVDRCRGLDSGLYYYDAERHRLVRRTGRTHEVETLLKTAAAMALSSTLPQVLICMASRFQRVSWSYEGVAYAVTLKNVGALYQTLYLVATAMGLAGCGLGAGDSELFARAAGTDYYEETTVGEFLLGSR